MMWKAKEKHATHHFMENLMASDKTKFIVEWRKTVCQASY